MKLLILPYITLATMSIFISTATALPGKSSHQRITAHDGRAHSSGNEVEVQDDFEINPVIVDSELREEEEASSAQAPPPPPKKHTHKHHHRKVNSSGTGSNGGGGGGNGSNDNGVRELRKRKVNGRQQRLRERGRQRGRGMSASEQSFKSRGRRMEDPETDASQPPSEPSKPYGTVVSRGKNDTSNQTKYDSLLVDLPEYDDTEEDEGFETVMEPQTKPPPTTTTTRATTTSKPTTEQTTPTPVEVTTVYRAPTTEVLDLLDDNDDVTSTSPHPRPTPVLPKAAPRPHTTGRSDAPAAPERLSTVGTGKKDIKLVQEAGYRPEAKTKSTVYRGLIMNLENDKRVFTFYGIGYAAPPLDNLRFKRPFPAEPPSRDGAFEATRLNPPCFPSRIGRSSTSAAFTINKEQEANHNSNHNSMTLASEDCLYLNIWLPDKVVLDEQPGQSTLYPVVIWIHGEGFLSGMVKEDYKSAAEFVAETDIIVVAIQYRLGVFGFLQMGSESSGNMGLQDQVLALKWIEENIECFGGDPHAVTIMGHDIGAAFVGYHLVSKISPGYFSRAVMIGGSPLQPHMFHTRSHANRIAMEFATQLGCVNSKSTKSIMDCLLNMDPVSIWEVQILLLQQGHNVLTFPFVPTDDGYLLSGSPVQLLDNGRGKTCQVLLGGSSNEGSLVLANTVEGVAPHSPTFISYDKFTSIMRHILDEFSELEMDAVLHQYKNWENLMDGYANQIRAADAVGDFYFTCPLRKFSDLWSARGLPTYHFSFSHQSSAKNRSSWMGSVHGDELDYFFGVPLRFPDQFTDEEEELSRQAMKVLENFIKMGDPHEDWERYGKETPHFAEFTANGNFYGSVSEPRYGPRSEHCAFWNDLFPKFTSSGQSSAGNIGATSNSRTSSRYNSFDFEPPGGGGASINGSLYSKSFSVDENCFVALHNCSRSNFAIYVN